MQQFLILASLLLPPIIALAQETVAPTPLAVGNRRGEDVQGYNVVYNFETGYRFLSAGGDVDKYRSDVNYGNGIRLLSSYLVVHSKQGHGGLFDEIVLTTQGLGNDPYESATLRVRKNRVYRYDMSWRSNQYFNPALTIANGEHFQNTEHRFQDHDFTLFPQSNLKFFLGYSRDVETGPALNTIQLFDSRGNEFPLFENVRWMHNEYRLGGEFVLFGFRVNALHGWDDFKDDTVDHSNGLNPGDNPASPVTLTAFQRNQPYHGTSPYWRVGLFREGPKWYAVNGRFTYTAGRRAFVQDESALGTSRFGAPFNRQILTYGDADRPVATGNLTVSFFPWTNVTLTNHTSVYNQRIDGNSFFTQVDNSTLAFQTLNFQYLGIRTVANSTDLDVRPFRWLAFYTGYTYSNRRIKSIEQFATPNQPDSTSALTGDQTSQLHEGVVGIRIKPIPALTINLETQIGRTDQPFYPTSDKNYHTLGGRVIYKRKNLTLMALARSNYNNNSNSLTAYSSKSRTYSADGTWTPKDWFSLDAGYSKLHLNTVGGIAYFANGDFVTGDQSYYFSNIHSVHAGVRFAFLKRADLYLGLNRIQDTGDGRATPFGNSIGSVLPGFQAAQTFPLTFQSPLARLSLKLTEKVRWNFGYQYYGYREQFYFQQNYRANTGYTSVLWTF